jgi:hypothetical protein
MLSHLTLHEAFPTMLLIAAAFALGAMILRAWRRG